MDTRIPLIELDAPPEGRGRRVCKAGHDLALFRIDGAVYAIHDSCPHAGGSLSNGKVQGRRVSCPVHGLKFELDPHACRSATPQLQAKQHVVQIVDGVVMLVPGDASARPAA